MHFCDKVELVEEGTCVQVEVPFPFTAGGQTTGCYYNENTFKNTNLLGK